MEFQIQAREPSSPPSPQQSNIRHLFRKGFLQNFQSLALLSGREEEPRAHAGTCVFLLPLGHSLMKVRPVKLVSQNGDDLLSAMTLTHKGHKEELRIPGCNGGSRLQDRSPVCSLLSATRMVTHLLTSFMPHARQSWGGPCPAKPTGSSNSMPSPANLQERERQKIFLVGMESITFLTMANGWQREGRGVLITEEYRNDSQRFKSSHDQKICSCVKF